VSKMSEKRNSIGLIALLPETDKREDTPINFHGAGQQTMKPFLLIVVLLIFISLATIGQPASATGQRTARTIICPNPNCRRENPSWGQICQYCGKPLRKKKIRSRAPGHIHSSGGSSGGFHTDDSNGPIHPSVQPYAEFVNKGNQAIAASDWNSAAKLFDKALEKDGNGLDALRGAAFSECKLAHKDRAFNRATKALRLGDKGLWIHFALGITTDEDEKAIGHLYACLSSSDRRISSDAQASLQKRCGNETKLGKDAVDATRWDDAKRLFDLALRCIPDDAEASAGMGITLHELSFATGAADLDRRARQFATAAASKGNHSPWVSFVLAVTEETSETVSKGLTEYVHSNPDGPFLKEAKDHLANIQVSKPELASIAITTNVAGHIVVSDSTGKPVFEQDVAATIPTQTPSLPFGEYKVAATADGFIKSEKNVSLTATTKEVGFTLEVAHAETPEKWNPTPFDLSRSGVSAGDTMVNPVDFSVFVWVPEGSYKYGKGNKTGNLPGYWIGKNCVTWSQYIEFCDKTHRTQPEQPGFPIEPDHPVVNVTWDDAMAYAKWVGATLPTELQWEKAARSTDGRIYPWGDIWDPGRAQVSEQFDGSAKSTAPVSAHDSGKSPYGCRDMVGNVAQWVLEKSGGKPVVRGRGWFDSEEDHWKLGPCVAATRITSKHPLGRDIGFRIASPLDSTSRRGKRGRYSN